MTSDVYDPLVALYGPRLMRLAKKARADIVVRGLAATEPETWEADEYAVQILVRAEGRAIDAEAGDGDIDVRLSLIDAVDYDGNENGMSFSLDMVEWGGLILSHFTPFNYSDDVWVDPRDASAVEERWLHFVRAVEGADLAGRIKEWRETHQ